MARALSLISPEWWDYTTLDNELVEDAAKLTPEQMLDLSREGFKVVFYDTLDEFYLAEALEYVEAWKRATADNPVGICGPIGPTEQLPLVARIVNSVELSLKHAHFWGMDEWINDEKEVPISHPLSFESADRRLCFDRISTKLVMPEENMHFPKADISKYVASWEGAKCAVMQGGQGDAKHWAFNDPPKREHPYIDDPPPPEVYRKLATRVVDLHPLTVLQNSRTSASGNIPDVPSQAITVGPVETWKAERISIWQPGTHDNALGLRLTTFMISKQIRDVSVPMSLLAQHPNVQFNFYRPGIGTCKTEIH